MANKVYDIVWSKMVEILLPLSLRTAKQKSWLVALLTPVSTLHATFKSWSTEQRYFLQHTGQVIYLEKVLNDKFGSEDYDSTDHENTKEIYITDGTRPTRKYIYKRSEDNPVFLNPTVFIDSRATFEAIYFDFLVNVPDTITYDTNEMIALVNRYRLAGKYFKIIDL